MQPRSGQKQPHSSTHTIAEPILPRLCPSAQFTAIRAIRLERSAIRRNGIGLSRFLVGRIFFRRTGGHFVGKCSSGNVIGGARAWRGRCGRRWREPCFPSDMAWTGTLVCVFRQRTSDPIARFAKRKSDGGRISSNSLNGRWNAIKIADPSRRRNMTVQLRRATRIGLIAFNVNMRQAR